MFGGLFIAVYSIVYNCTSKRSSDIFPLLFRIVSSLVVFVFVYFGPIFSSNFGTSEVSVSGTICVWTK
jgi:cellulose synthase/poly-beta-1,6-N-acetylglucosamine synthase-like glycosyltransferase